MQFNNVVVQPGGTHVIQSFIGCIAKLIVAGAYAGLTGGKSWVKAMRGSSSGFCTLG